MLKKAALYYLSPTGGTKKVGRLFASALAENVTEADLLSAAAINTDGCEAVIAAVPVFGGRVPEPARQALMRLEGGGSPAVALAVFGNRAYDDALCELCDILSGRGFVVVGAAALNAKHSVVPKVGAGRPDAQDRQDIASFANAVLEKLRCGDSSVPQVPGNRPYKQGGGSPSTPVCLESCILCGACVGACRVGAVSIEDGVCTDSEKCYLCMACIAACPMGARVLPEAMQQALNEKLLPLKDVRTPNEWYV